MSHIVYKKTKTGKIRGVILLNRAGRDGGFHRVGIGFSTTLLDEFLRL